MANSRSLMFSVLLSGLVFSAATLPLVIMGSRPITIEIEEKPLLTGRIQDLASPYLGLVIGLSAGVGLATLALGEWRDTSRKLNRMRDRVTALEHQLQQQEHQVERLKFSESRLQSQGLNFFLDADAALSPASLPSLPAFPPTAPAVQTERIPVKEVHHAAPQNGVPPVGQSSPMPSQIEELTTALKQLVNQVEQLKGSDASNEAIGHSLGSSVNASARA